MCARHCSKHFTKINSFNLYDPYGSLMVQYLPHLHSKGKVTERLGNLRVVILSAAGGAVWALDSVLPRHTAPAPFPVYRFT